MRIDVVSIFPQYLEPLQLSLVGKAVQSGLVDLRVHDLRDWTSDRHRSVDDTPYGGGAGMVMRPEPWGAALDAITEGAEGPRLIVLTPSGRLFDQALAAELSAESQLIFACGRYEGIDARVVEHARTRMRTDEVSIGDYVLNGGEAAALVMIESVVRLLPGVLGNPESLTEESHAAGQDGLLEYPLYTKPPSWRGLDVPDVLFSGHHARIAGWRRQQAVARTAERRPELLPDPHWQLGEAVLPDAVLSDAVLSDAVLSDTVLSDTVLSDAVLSDAGELFTLQRAAFFQEAVLNGSMELPPLMQSYEELQASLEHATVLVARRRGRLIGSVRGESWPDDVWYVGRLMVAPDLQGQGLGGRLMTEIEARAPGSTRSFRLVTGRASTQNIDFYRRRGYTSVAYDVDDVGVPIAILEKRLPA